MSSVIQMDFSDANHVKITFISMAFFFTFYVVIYRILRSKLNINGEYECRLLTFAHGLFSSIVCLHYVNLPALGYYKVDSIPYQIILSHSFGFFLFDLIWCYIHGEAGVMKFHHIVTVTGLMYYSFKLRQQYIIVYALGLTEFTNPFLQLRWYLKYHGMRDGLFFKMVEVLFIILFLYLRVVVFSYYTFRAWTDSSLNFTPDDLFFISLGLVVGYSLAYQMVGYILYQLRKSKTQRVDKYE